jgi:hypothetical protein
MRRNAHVAVYLGMINQSQELVYLNNSQYLKENHTGSHLENEVTISSKITPSKPIRKSVDDHGSTTRVLFTEENTDGEF